MKVAVCSAQAYDREFLSTANRDFAHELVFFDSRLNRETRQIVAGFPADDTELSVLRNIQAVGYGR